MHFLTTGAGCWGIITLSEHAALTAAARNIIKQNFIFFLKDVLRNKINIASYSPSSFPPPRVQSRAVGLSLPWQVWPESSWDAVSSLSLSPSPLASVTQCHCTGRWEGRHGGKQRLETEIKLDK